MSRNIFKSGSNAWVHGESLSRKLLKQMLGGEASGVASGQNALGNSPCTECVLTDSRALNLPPTCLHSALFRYIHSLQCQDRAAKARRLGLQS